MSQPFWPWIKTKESSAPPNRFLLWLSLHIAIKILVTTSTNALSRNDRRYPITLINTPAPPAGMRWGKPLVSFFVPVISAWPRWSLLGLSQAGSPNHVNLKDALGAAFPARLSWTNNPNELLLSKYFRPNPPNLATSYRIPGLRPVLKQPSGNMFLLADNSGNFYICVRYEVGLFLMNDHLDLQEAIPEAIAKPFEEDLTLISRSYSSISS